MDVCGEADAVGRVHLLRLAAEGGVAVKVAEKVIGRMLEQAEGVVQRAAGFAIRRGTVQRMRVVIEGCRRRVSEA